VKGPTVLNYHHFYWPEGILGADIFPSRAKIHDQDTVWKLVWLTNLYFCRTDGLGRTAYGEQGYEVKEEVRYCQSEWKNLGNLAYIINLMVTVVAVGFIYIIFG
jgi:hypothetical protein